MPIFKNTALAIFFAFLIAATLYPNPFGNNPDAIEDESYFLTSALSSIQKVTLPGWEFSQSGTYYGGVQAYVDTAAMVVAVGVVVAASHFSLGAAKAWIAINTGQLLHVLRLVNGAAALIAIALTFFFFRRKKIPTELGLTLTLFLFLLLSNVLVVEFLHTAKMWVFYIIITALLSVFFIAQEYYLLHENRPFFSKSTYVALLIWGGLLLFFQSYVGAFSAALLALYALLLGHITIRDLWMHVKKYWYLMVALAATQISFMYRFVEMFTQFYGVSTRTAGGAVDWTDRIVQPLAVTVQGQPLSVLYLLGLAVLFVLFFYKRSFFAPSRKRTYLAIACLHPVAVYLFFYILVGFDLLPRYGIMLTIACAFSAAMLLAEFGKRAVIAAIIASAALLLVVDAHAIELYWHPSSESILLETIEENDNSPDDIFVIDHSARHLTLPINAPSLSELDAQRQDMSRYEYLLQTPAALANAPFKPVSLIAYTQDEESAELAQFEQEPYSVWLISSDCSDLCSPQDEQAGSCFELHINACGIEPQEVNTLPVFLSSDQLGYSYIVRRIYPAAGTLKM